MAEEQKEDLSFELGDTIYLSGKNGAWEVTGRIYYLDESRIQILPTDKARNLETIEIEDGEFDPEAEIENLVLIKKRTDPAFVVQSNFHVGQVVDTIQEDGTLGTTFKITAVDPKEDKATFEDESGGVTTIEFNFMGIPREYNSQFMIMRSREAPLPVVELEGVEREEAVPEEKEEELDLEVLGELEVAETREVVLVPKTEQIIDDPIQYSDMFQDLLNCLKTYQQKSPKYQAQARELVELMMSLRNDITRYTKSGEPNGMKSTSYLSLGQLLDNVSVPLAKPVIEAKRALYFDLSKKYFKEFEPPSYLTEIEGVKIRYLSLAVINAIEYYENQIARKREGAEKLDSLPNWYIDWDGYFQNFMQSWVPTGEGQQKSFLKDQEFFRAPLPEVESEGGFSAAGTEKKRIFSPVVGGLEKDKDKDKDKPLLAGSETLIGLSVLRGTSGRTGRLKPSESPRILESPEQGVIRSQVLFPLQFLREFGAIRSSKLAMDIGTSMLKPFSIQKILLDKGGITDIPSAGAILAISSSSLGNISIEDWLENQPLESRGLGDIHTYLASLGLSEIDFTTDQLSVLTSKVNLFLANVRDTLVKLNAESQKQLSELTLTNRTLLPQERANELINNLHADYLNEQIELFRNRFPSYRENDLALFSFFMPKYTDYALAILAKGEGLARESIRIRRENYMEAVHRREILNQKKKLIGQIPTPNPCAHVRAIGIIRKVKDTESYFKLLAKFITKFGSERKDNWLHCTLCNQECLCYHEMLLLQEFLRPREKDVLHKELLLGFSDGQFQGKYCCKNCGQPMGDLDFDKGMEYDEDGRPMSGRAQLVDQDAVEQEQLDMFLGAPAEKVEAVDFKTDRQNLIYKTALQLADKIGIVFSKEDLKKVVMRVEGEMLRQPSVEEYSIKFKEAKASGRAIPDYTTLIHRVLVCATAAHLLICVQTNIPGYVVRYILEGCKVGFSGFPFGEESDKTGINYLACAVGGMMKNEAPWNLTGFQKGAKDKREALIASYITKLSQVALSEMSVQEDIDRKKEHNEKLFGEAAEDGKLKESVPSGFLPPQLKAEDAASAPIVEAAATTPQKIQAWFLQANQLAFSTGVLDKRSVYSATTCCFTPLQEPGQFWKNQTDLIKLPEETKLSGSVGSHLNIHFKAPPLDILNVIASEKDYYKLFLQICFQGPREGMKHEPGYDHVCPFCDFAFPKDPALMDYEKDGRAALSSQGIDTSKAAFEALVDKMHLIYKIEKPTKVKVSAGTELLMKLAEITPPPFDGWKEMIYDVKEKLVAIPEDKANDELEIATAYNTLSNKAREDFDEIVKRMGEENSTTLERMVEQSMSSAIQSIHDYLMIPYLRLSNRFNVNSLRIQKHYALPDQTEKDILEDLRLHLQYNNEIVTKNYLKGLTGAKVKYASQQLQALLTFLQKEVRIPLLPGGKVGGPYILKAALYGILQQFINPNEVPPTYSDFTTEPGSLGDVSSRAALQILYILLKRFREEGVNFSPDQIREALAKRREAEKLRIINRLDRMTPEEKRVELLNKKYGLGDWAIGGSKGIAVLNAEQYDYENWELFQMGAKKRREREADNSGFMTGAVAEEGYDAHDRSKDDD
jgi:hypothetical protein